MCNIIQNCEIHNNFFCPDDDIKPLMNACCSLWNDDFECVSGTSQPKELPNQLPTESPTKLQIKLKTELPTAQNDSFTLTSVLREEDSEKTMF